MAGTIPLSMTQQFDQLGEPLSGGKLYGIQAATVSTPQNFFQDINLALPWPNPITLDAAGRIPQLFIADGLIKIRLTDASGVVQLVADNVQVIGSSSGGGGGGTVDPLTIFVTGDIKARYGVGVHPGTAPGWVRCNGLTVGAAGSGATELAHANCQALFEYLWSADRNLVVSGGRGTNAHSDWLGGKQIALPDWRGRLIAGMDDMGNAVAGRLTVAGSGIDGTALGAFGGLQSTTLLQSQLPNVTPTFSGTLATLSMSSGSTVVFGTISTALAARLNSSAVGWALNLSRGRYRRPSSILSLSRNYKAAQV